MSTAPPLKRQSRSGRTSTAQTRTGTLRLADSPDRLPLRRMELFTGIPDGDLDILEARLGMIRWPQGAEEPAPLERLDHVYLVREGRLALYERISPDHEVMVAILEPGAIWSTLGNVTPPGLAALEASAISPLPARALEALSTRYPRLGRNLAAMLSERVNTLSQTIAMVSEMRVEDRLRARLHQLAERFGVTGKDGIRLHLDLTHAQWASLVGASREAVTTAFGKLKSQNDVELDGRDILIPWSAVHEHEAGLNEALAVG